MHILLVALLFAQARQASPLLDNDFVQVFRNNAPCAAAALSCGERVIVALGPVELSGQKMERGDIKAFKMGERYSPPQRGEYLEVTVKPAHPKVAAPASNRSGRRRIHPRLLSASPMCAPARCF